MTNPSELPEGIEQWAWDEAMRCLVGDDLNEAEVLSASVVYAEGLRTLARALQSTHARGVAEGKAEQPINKGKIIEAVCPQGVDEWSVSLVLDAIRQQPKGESRG